MNWQDEGRRAAALDETDPLKFMRERFIIPASAGTEQVYLLGNSLGLQPKAAKTQLQRVLDDWSMLGVEGFFHAGEPWMDYHDRLTGTLSRIMGARPAEIVVMNQLTVNLHLMMVSFYRPTTTRFKIICEAHAFPSDQYAFETQIRHHGLDPADCLVEVGPRGGEDLLRTEDILQAIREHGPETALVLFSGINYYTGQFFELDRIAGAARLAGARVGFDLAHAAGNVPLQLHDWDVDFACWCSYKYLNSGPGAVGGVFIHDKNHDAALPRFAGWWGYDRPTRFRMQQGFIPMPGAEGWQLSTPSILLYATHRAALELVDEAGWERIQAKRVALTAYAWELLNRVQEETGGAFFRILTPVEPADRGSQVSLLMLLHGRAVFDRLTADGVLVDWREPDVIRLAPVPLYNSHTDVWRFATSFRKALLGLSSRHDA